VLLDVSIDVFTMALDTAVMDTSNSIGCVYYIMWLLLGAVTVNYFVT
jgi:hypothetical protein